MKEEKGTEIAAKDLRLGNWVRFGEASLQVSAINALNIHLGINTRCAVAKLRPIPIDASILEKAGFAYSMYDSITSLDEDRVEGNTYNWTIKVKRNDVYDGQRGAIELVKWGDDDDIWFSEGWMRIRVRYLHQLQNLFFALTGEELTINL